MDKLIGDAHRSRVKQEHPTLDDAAVNQIVEEMQRVYPLIREACRKQVEQQHPDFDEAAVDASMAQTPMPPMWLVERALVQRLHLPEVERMQQVVVMMLPKLLGEPIKKNTIRPEG